MKQIIQSLKDGSTILEDVPTPRTRRGSLLIETSSSLVSAGTERMLVDFGKSNWVERARQQPDKVRMVLEKLRTDGVVATFEAVQSKLDQPLPLGYCNVGRVIEVGAGVAGFQPGDRVVSNGPHAEAVSVPRNLCAPVPDSVSDEHGAFTVLGAIGLQGVRLAAPTIGECVVVTGLGLIGLMTVQILRAQGCRVLGIDLDPSRLELAAQFGAEVVNPAKGEDVLARANAFSRGRGVDAVLITASTRSSEPVSQAAKMCRKRGRIVLVGVTGLELSRADFYEKELSFQVSCSYGPGRYDPAYEEQGQDYPVGYVRWTEQRNFEAVLDLMASGALDLEPLISHRFALQDAPRAYELLSSGEPSLGILLQYPGLGNAPTERAVSLPGHGMGEGGSAQQPAVGFIGAGNYAGRVLIPAFRKAGARLEMVASGGGVSAVHYGKKHGFARATTDVASMLEDDALNTVIIATRHDQHAGQVLDALRAGKHVFCEKPLCLTHEELDAIEQEASGRPGQKLMVGFNRRFAPHVHRIHQGLRAAKQPAAFVMTINAGEIPADHWTQDPAQGGGRIVGEACHFIDLLRYLAGVPVDHWSAMSMGPSAGLGITDDKAFINLHFSDGSMGTIQYLANGSKRFPKERLEVFCGGRILRLDNFRRLQAFDWPGVRAMRLMRQDKGQADCAAAFLASVSKGEASPIPLDELIEVSRVTLNIAQDLRG